MSNVGTQAARTEKKEKKKKIQFSKMFLKLSQLKSVKIINN